MNFNYTRRYGRKKKNTSSPVPTCQFCHDSTVVSVPVFLRMSDEPQDSMVVCYKNICIACGKIQYFINVDEAGNKKQSYAFWLHSGRKCRDFNLPRQLFETADGKADVGYKVRFIRALLCLQIARPTEKIFTRQEVEDELKKQELGQ